MAGVGRRDDNGHTQAEGLGREYYVAIEAGVGGRRLPGASCPGPKFRCYSHRVRRHGSRSPVAFRLALSAWHRSYPSGNLGAVAMTAYISSRDWADLIRCA